MPVPESALTGSRDTPTSLSVDASLSSDTAAAFSSHRASAELKDCEPLTSMGSQESSNRAINRAEVKPSVRMTSLLAKKADVESKLEALKAQFATRVAESKLSSGLTMPAAWSEEQKIAQALSTANADVKEHIEHLHRYNEIKDIGLGLMGLVAEQRGVRQIVVMDEFGVSSKD